MVSFRFVRLFPPGDGEILKRVLCLRIRSRGSSHPEVQEHGAARDLEREAGGGSDGGAVAGRARGTCERRGSLPGREGNISTSRSFPDTLGRLEDYEVHFRFFFGGRITTERPTLSGA